MTVTTEPSTTDITCTCKIVCEGTPSEYRAADRDCPRHRAPGGRQDDAPNNAAPCPVEWCDQFGHHLYDDEQPATIAENLRLGYRTSEHMRTCRHEVGSLDIGQVAAEIHENDEGVLDGPYVEFEAPNSNELRTPEQVAVFLLALVEASRIAFGGVDQ